MRYLQFLREFRAVQGNAANVVHLCAIDSKDKTVARIRYGILRSKAYLYSVNVDPDYRNKGLATYLRYMMSKHAVQEENAQIIHRNNWTDMGESRFAHDPEIGDEKNLEERVIERHGTIVYSCLG